MKGRPRRAKRRGRPSELAGSHLQNRHLVFAYIILMGLPLLITVVVAQCRIISGITGGAVK